MALKAAVDTVMVTVKVAVIGVQVEVAVNGNYGGCRPFAAYASYS